MNDVLTKPSLGYNKLLERIIMLEKKLDDYHNKHKKLKMKVELIEDDVDDLLSNFV